VPHFTVKEVDQAATAKRRKKKKPLSTGQPPGKTELLLKYQHQDWIMEE
jgi:hypothetical protein